jgi:hypothetical protein
MFKKKICMFEKAPVRAPTAKHLDWIALSGPRSHLQIEAYKLSRIKSIISKV